ncbi:MAG: hypothetical protein IJE78_06930 [Bacteroidaceae bacterium]|nr:hypothetical protein [Bacteroidaceae bacterium]
MEIADIILDIFFNNATSFIGFRRDFTPNKPQRRPGAVKECQIAGDYVFSL